MDFKALLNTPEYNFLRTNEHLKDRIILLGLGGSHAYGTNIEGSDVDVRGVALNSRQDLIGLSSFDQFVNEATDTTIYSFNKIVKLLMNTNPNTIELLGLKPEHYLHISPEGQLLLDNRKLFLSKKAVYSFGGYANQQLMRLKNNIARYEYEQSEKERHLLQSVNSALYDFHNRYQPFEDGNIKLYVDKAVQPDFDTEIFMDINLKHYPLRDYKSIWSEMNNIVKDYTQIGKRNKKKDGAHMAKHMMHLIRLYLMCIDILEKEEIVTYRADEHDLLMSIRNGKYMVKKELTAPEVESLLRKKETITINLKELEQGYEGMDPKLYYDLHVEIESQLEDIERQLSDNYAVSDEFWEMLTGYENHFQYAKKHTNLPESPNFKSIEELVMTVNLKSI